MIDFINDGLERRQLILEKVSSKTKTLDCGCIVWTGGTSGTGRGGGYGRMSFEGRTSSVHKIVFETIYGPVPPRKQIDHTCKNRLCCNPKHLELVTHKENQKRKFK